MRRLPSWRPVTSLALVAACGTQDRPADPPADAAPAAPKVADDLANFATGGLHGMIAVETR